MAATHKDRRIYRTKTWRQVRRLTLMRDRFECQIKMEGCTHIATQCDHKMPLYLGGHPYDLDNLRAACEWCNKHRKANPPSNPSRVW